MRVAFTFFFRDMQVLDAAVHYALPGFAGCARPRVWDAGCATGQESYSLAVLLAESMTHFGFSNMTILATDVDDNGCFGPIVQEGRYPKVELERIPSEYRDKYFEAAEDPDCLRVIEPLRARVRYRKHDLLTLHPPGEEFNLIVCKNVLLHFQPSDRDAVLRMFHAVLREGGHLAIEQTQKIPPGLQHLFVQVAANGQLFRKAGSRAQDCR
jgi:chemotaxis protein methyltransferase CheR